jgi:hypothetical protein
VRYFDACDSLICGADFGGLGGDRFDQIPLNLGAKQRIDVNIATLARRVAQIQFFPVVNPLHQAADRPASCIWAKAIYPADATGKWRYIKTVTFGEFL